MHRERAILLVHLTSSTPLCILRPKQDGVREARGIAGSRGGGAAVAGGMLSDDAATVLKFQQQRDLNTQ